MSLLVEKPGRCMSPADALGLLEQMEAQISPKQDTDLAYAMNTVRYVLAREIPVAPKLHDGKTWKYSFSCGRCGSVIRTGEVFCGRCGQRCTDDYLGGRKTKEEQQKYSSPAMREAIEVVAQSMKQAAEPADIDLNEFLKEAEP